MSSKKVLPASASHLTPVLRVNGVIHLSVETIKSLEFKEHMFEIYDQAQGYARVSLDEEQCGLSEWVANSLPALSLGWDWKTEKNEMVLDGTPFTNFVLTDEMGNTLTTEANTTIVNELIESLNWKKVSGECVIGGFDGALH
jgi:hypothetical protein